MRDVKKTNWSIAGQLVVAKGEPRFSHVMLCIMPGLYVHSMPDGGVHLVATEDPNWDFGKLHRDAWSVRRHRRLAEDPELVGTLPWRAAYYLGQRYNQLFFASSSIGDLLSADYATSHSFCSELVSRIFSDLGLPYPEHSDHSSVLPIHLDLWSSTAPWDEVTNAYRDFFAGRLTVTPIEGLLDEMLPVPDQRPDVLTTFRDMFNAAMNSEKTAQLVNATVVALNESMRERPSEGDLMSLATSSGLDVRAVRLYGSTLRSILAAESLAERSATLDPVFWFQRTRTIAPIDLQAVRASNAKVAAALVDQLTAYGQRFLTDGESIRTVLPARKFLGAEAPPEQRETATKMKEAAQSLADSLVLISSRIMSGENLDTELPELEAECRQQLSSAQVLTDQGRNHVRTLLWAINWWKTAHEGHLLDRIARLALSASMSETVTP
jgi:hypothetical protein